MNRDRKPLPRFWYLPRGQKAAVVMTGRRSRQRRHGGRFDAAQGGKPGRLLGRADWECVRATSYLSRTRRARETTGRGGTRRTGSRSALHISSNCAGLDTRLARGRATRRSSPTFAVSARSASARPTAPTVSRGATRRRSRGGARGTGFGSTRTTTTGPTAGCRTGPASSPDPGMPMRFADLTARRSTSTRRRRR